jgi:photosystem II stability/assembly factor-like uncharacterized protein
MNKTLVLVGTRKGAFFLWSDAARREWRIEGPILKGWEVQDLTLDTRRGRPELFAAVGHFVYGATVQHSLDFGRSWTQIEYGPEYPDGAGSQLKRIWCIEPGHPSEPEVLWAGVDEAGLFVSEDGGESWREVPALRQHSTREGWMPGLGGLCCHTVCIDPGDPRRMWLGISAVGVFRTTDRGESWQVANEGLPIVSPAKDFRDIGSCIHRIVVSPDEPGVLYQQNHRGVFRSRDGADSWQRIEAGLPATFGFPIVLDPRRSRTLYVLPQESDEYRFFPDGQLAVYRSQDGGDSWHALTHGFPAGPAYTGVLRNAMAVDGREACGIYFGTTGGQLFYSRDGGEAWHTMPCLLPRITSVTAVTVED